MRLYNSQNVYDAALERINFLFDEFPNVVVGFSSGKDSVVVLNLALQVATERNRLPLKVMFLDQELEWEATIDLVKKVMYSPVIDPMWLQIPFKLFNATSGEEQWLHVWGEGEELLRLKHITGFSKLFKDVKYSKSWQTDKMVRIKKDYMEHNDEQSN